MKRMIAAAIVALALSGCAQVQTVAESENTFIACKLADVLTTKIALNSGLAHEANPLLATLIGPHNFVPLIAFSVAVYFGLRYINEPKAWMVANGVTCGVAAHNAVLLKGAGIMH